MSNKLILVLVIVVAIIAVGVWVSTKYISKQGPESGSVSDGASQGPIVKTATSSTLGEYLTDGKGITLYMSLSQCSGSCLESWIPYIATPVADIKSDDPILKKINLVRLSDGRYQYGYGDKLLYYYRGDAKPGDTKGHDIADGKWTVIVNP